MSGLGSPALLTVIGVVIVSSQAFQYWRERHAGKRSLTTGLGFLIGCDLIAAPLLERLAPMLPVLIAVGLAIAMGATLFSRGKPE
jgi:hypothetical protein